MQTAIANTFQASLARLTADEQRQAKVTVYDFQEDPSRPGLKFHRLEKSADKDLWSLRATDDLRLIVLKRGDRAVFAYVDHHDAAYRWAEKRRFIPNPSTGALQVVEVEEVIQQVVRRVVRDEAVAGPLFAHHEPAYLLKLGVPEAWLDAVRGVGEAGLLELAGHLPEEAMENLLDLATGAPVLLPTPPAAGQDPLDHPDARRRFTLAADDAQLRRVLEQPMDAWLVFLHPSQRDAVEQSYRGPAKVTGGAGTGKTVVALHRAARLALARNDARVLLTTFTRTLAARLGQHLDLLLEPGSPERARVKVAHLHAVAWDIVRQPGGAHRAGGNGAPANGAARGTDGRPQVGAEPHGPARDARAPLVPDERELRHRIEPLLRQAGADVSVAFVLAELRDVIDPLGITTQRDYLLAHRDGAGAPLQQAERIRLWRVLGPLLAGLEADGRMSFDRMCHVAAATLDQAPDRPFDHVVVDETQDLGPAELALVRALVRPAPDDVFLCGDGGQRIYRNRTSFARHGLEVRGRATVLRLNYRTTEQIRRYADALHPATRRAEDDQEEDAEEDRRNVSLLSGPRPAVVGFHAVADETEQIAERLAGWIAAGLEPGDIALFSRTRALLQRRAEAAVRRAGLEAQELDGEAPVDRRRVALGTMHNAKGLEFRAVVVVGADADQLPQRSALLGFDGEAARGRFRERERNLFYVACTRAREELVVTHVGPASAFLTADAVGRATAR